MLCVQTRRTMPTPEYCHSQHLGERGHRRGLRLGLQCCRNDGDRDDAALPLELPINLCVRAAWGTGEGTEREGLARRPGWRGHWTQLRKKGDFLRQGSLDEQETKRN